MTLPPEPMDPSKDFFKELVRYTIEHQKYLRALDGGYNDHGPWQKVETPKPLYGLGFTSKREDDPSEHYYWDRDK